MKNQTLVSIVGLLVCVFVIGGSVLAYDSQRVFQNIENYYEAGEGNLGGIYNNRGIHDFPDGISISGTTFIDSGRDLAVDDAAIEDDLTVSGDSTLAGLTVSGVSTLATTTLKEPVVTLTGTTTLTTAQSGSTFYLDMTDGSAITLPVATSAAGVIYKFVVADNFATSDITITSAEGDNIEGTLIVAGAVVDCDASDVITFVDDGENIGDYVELRSNGSKWFIGGSGALTGSKLTCSG